ncbi:Smr/MutS family protein [Undibacterium cyanobacteriorum]|uniref:Smr/MutS family protein n=1 Tax=Undibacterium cyanobacteriorum TaxID=3073561 RepID=A0ABY9RE75_9BURK|nr:Smr/MutS family protein [Undibacterium sp. 20NA77.5]WMW79518.1 Smr/MutS family protein [Undibacterium sp. 20NA77.5]
MAGSLKSLADLQQVSKQLKAQQELRAKQEAERKAREKQAALEANLFRNTVGEVQALKSKNVANHHPQPPKPAPIPYQYLADEKAAFQESISDEFDAASLLDSDENLSYTRPGVGIDVAKKLRQGEWTIQAQLDLHGMRRDQARDNLGEFIRRCVRNGYRCVRVIHGKGLGSVNKEPVLKNKVRNWLIQKEEVIAFSQATAADGGAGALIVLLRSS